MDNVEKLFRIKPGASAEFIKVQLDGSNSLRVNQDGQLEADTALGTWCRFTRPNAYQEIEGKRVAVECNYTIAECRKQNIKQFSNPKLINSESSIPHSEYGFTVAFYDKTKDLIIDPLLASSTYLGGFSGWAGDYGDSIVMDKSGSVYVAGMTFSSVFPTTNGAFDTNYNGGDGDAFVAKLSSDLSSLLVSTYLGVHLLMGWGARV